MKSFSLQSLIWGFLFILCSSPLLAQESVIDSLKLRLAQAKPGYDQVDYLIGIARAYIFISKEEKVRETLQQVWVIALEHKDLSAQSNIKVMENIMAFTFEGDGEKALRLTAEAVELAKASGDQDALAFATYQYAENFSFEKANYKKAITLLQDFLAQTDETVTQKNLGNVYKNLGYAHTQLGEYPQALDYFDKALAAFDIVTTNPDLHHRLGRVSAMYADGGVANKGQVLHYISNVHQRIGQFDKAEARLLEAYHLFRQHNIEDHIAWICGRLGSLYAQMGEYKKAITYLQEGIVRFEEIELERDVVELQMHLGDIFQELAEHKKADEFYTQAFDYYKEHQDTTRTVKVALKRITSFIALDNQTESLALLEEAKQMAQGLNSDELLADVQRQSAEVQQLLGNYMVAAERLQQVLNFARKRKDNKLEAGVLYDISENYFFQNQLDSAIAIGQQTLALAKAMNWSDLIGKTYQLLSQAYQKNGDFEAALTSFQSYHANEDSLLTADAQTILRQEQVRQNVNDYKEELETTALQAQLLATRNQLFLSITIALLILLALGGYLFFQLRKTKLALESKNQQLANLNQTKDKFFGIIAHDIRSPILALENVGEQMDYYLANGKTDKLQRLSQRVDITAKRLTTLLDNLLNWALLQQGVIPHHPNTLSLKEMVDQTVKMFQMSASLKDIELKNDVQEEILVVADESALNTILRNLMSNAIKFTPKGGSISVHTTLEKDQVILQVQDTGVGMDAQQLRHIFALDTKSSKGTAGERGTGLGLMLCKELVELNRGRITVQSQPQKGSEFRVYLPLSA